jgi:hypothetical protein
MNCGDYLQVFIFGYVILTVYLNTKLRRRVFSTSELDENKGQNAVS